MEPSFLGKRGSKKLNITKNSLRATPNSLLPNKIVVNRLAAVHQNALAGAKLVGDRKEISPFRHFLRGGPPPQGRFVHNFGPQRFVVHHASI